MKLDSIIELSPGFKTAVVIKADIDDDRKVGGYIPTEVSSETLLDFGENLHPLASRRSRIITGTYGTWKSHLALVLARICRDGISSDAVVPVIEKLGKWPGKIKKLKEERAKHKGKFLLVLLEGDEESFNDSLLRNLDSALFREGMGDLLSSPL